MSCAYYPEATTSLIGDETINIPEGMYLLGRMPIITSLSPQGFVSGSRAEFVKSRNGIQAYFTTVAPDVVSQWNSWEKEHVPASDCVTEYLDS